VSAPPAASPPTSSWSRRHNRRLATTAAAGLAVVGFVAAPIGTAVASGSHSAGTTGAVRPTGRLTHISRRPSLPSGAKILGATNPSRALTGAVALAPRDPEALRRAAAAVGNPHSTSFRHYLAKGAFAARYGPTAASIDAVKASLRASRLTVTSVSANGLLVHFSGTVASAESAFHTRIANVRLASGRVATETTSAVSLPASEASQVVSVVGLNTIAALQPHVERPSHPAAVAATSPKVSHVAGAPQACSGATGAAQLYGGLTDDQIAHAYGADGLYQQGDRGAGQTIAVYELEPFSSTDLQAFDTCYFGATAAAAMKARVSVHNVDGGAGTGAGSGESILDLEDISGLAPAANIEVYEAPNGIAGPLDLYDQIVQDDSASIVSTSWGECEALAQSTEPGFTTIENELFEQAALQGQSIFAASGDSGSDDCAEDAATPATPKLSVDDPASQPFVTGVGGTTITDAQNPPAEQVWNDGNIGGGGGGGVSSIWGAPSWQHAVLDTAAAGTAVSQGGLTPCEESSADGSGCREVPDVSAQADEYTGAITVYAKELGGWTTIGGTSSAAPLWAAMIADVDASSSCPASGVGFVSPALYAVASVPAAYAASFNDVKVSNNDVYALSKNHFFSAHPGYDPASGLGSPRLVGPNGTAGLAHYLCLMTGGSPAPPAVTSLIPAVETVAPTGPLTITGSGFTAATSVSVGGYQVPAADWTANGTDDTITISNVPTGSQAVTGGVGPQDGSGRAVVSVTANVNGQGLTSMADAASTLLYVDGTDASTPVPSVSGVSPFGGLQAGGNTVRVYGSGFASAPVDSVTFGGVAASDISVVSPDELTVTVPAFDSGTTVCAAGDDPVNDVCQVQVVVTNANGPSATAPILVPYTGAPFEGTTGGTAPPTCVTAGTCEDTAATTEYDYLPPPTITSITTTQAGDATTWASEQGNTVATIDGSGFDSLGFLWTTVGSPTVAANQDSQTISISPTEIQVVVNGHAFTRNPVTARLSVATLAGVSADSPASTITYAAVPTVSLVSPFAGPDTGGTSIVVHGSGLQGSASEDGGQLGYEYVDFGVTSAQLGGYSVSSDGTTLTAVTAAINPGLYLVQVCTITACSSPDTSSQLENSLFDFYQRGAPIVTGLSVGSGPASGGTRLVIHGRNLSDAILVKFGSTVAAAASAPEILTNGSSTEVDVVTPPGKAGSVVNVRVATVESLVTSGSASAPNVRAKFHYRTSVPSAARGVQARVHGASVSVHWTKPATTGGPSITHYKVAAVAEVTGDRAGAHRPPTVTVVTKPSARSATLIGLRAGWTYLVTVRAENRRGAGLVGTRREVTVREPA
jgi:hypothetical protein